MLVSLKGAKKRYGDFELDCTLEVAEGRITGIVGANGSGKSTTFKAILGLIKTDGGGISVLGKEPWSLTVEERRRIGVTMADSGFSGYLRVSDVAAVEKALYPAFDAARFDEACRESGIDGKKQLKELSRGMRARLHLMAAFCHSPELLLLDEPTSGLDVVARDEVLDILRQYMQTEGRGILISSHISSDLETLCDDIYMIDKGSVVLHEDTDRLRDSYGLIKATVEEFEQLDRSRLLRIKREDYGYACLTDDMGFYAKEYPGLVIERGGIDAVITMMIRGEKL